MNTLLEEILKAAGHTATTFDGDIQDYCRMKVDAYNEQDGHLAGRHCPKCRDKGYVMILDGMEEKLRECACMDARRAQWRIDDSGLGALMASCTLDTYRTDEAWQRAVKAGAIQYLGDTSRPAAWWYIGGQVGAGKTHICTALACEFLRRGTAARYMRWRDDSIALKAAINDDAYASMIEPLKRTPVLYIDDFLRAGHGEGGERRRPSPADINIALEILDARYVRPDTMTILSGEWYLDEVLGIDDALGSRIYARAKGYRYDITRDRSRNYRLQGAVTR